MNLNYKWIERHPFLRVVLVWVPETFDYLIQIK